MLSTIPSVWAWLYKCYLLSWYLCSLLAPNPFKALVEANKYLMNE